MSRISDIQDILNQMNESFILAPVATVMQFLQQEDLIKEYAIGGSVAIAIWSEPFDTDDIDIFCDFSPAVAGNLSLLRKRVEEAGLGQMRGMYLNIRGTKVQLQSVANGPPVELAAFKNATWIDCEGGIKARVFELEYALAMKAYANRIEDWLHISIALRSADIDMPKLEGILNKFQGKDGLLLWETWKEYYGR